MLHLPRQPRERLLDPHLEDLRLRLQSYPGLSAQRLAREIGVGATLAAGHPQKPGSSRGRSGESRPLRCPTIMGPPLADFRGHSGRFDLVHMGFRQNQPMFSRRSWKISRLKLQSRLQRVSFASARARPMVRMNSPNLFF